jgi:hypothetical protein
MRDYPTLATKIPPDLLAWVKQQAEKNSRSVSKQVAWMLSQLRQQEAKQ